MKTSDLISDLGHDFEDIGGNIICVKCYCNINESINRSTPYKRNVSVLNSCDDNIEIGLWSVYG